MKCSKCKELFPECEMEISHDIPRYADGTDLNGRHWLCKKHHYMYDTIILKRCLKFVGEDYHTEERIFWMKELSKQSEEMKKEFRKIAAEVKEEFFKDG